MYHIAMTQWIVGNEPMEKTCERLYRYGYDGIEFAAEPYELKPESCLRLMDKYHLNCRSLCGIFNKDRDLTDGGITGANAVRYIKDSVDFANEVGAKIIIIVPSPVGRTLMPSGMDMETLTNNAIQNIRDAADYAQMHGVILAIEAINRYETYFINTLNKALLLCKKINHPAVGLMADLFHMSIEEADICESLYKISDYLVHVHIADNTREAAGMGHTDFKSVLRTLKMLNYQGSLTMEFMYRLSDPYSATSIDTQADLMDRFSKQSIDYIKMIEKSIG